MTERAEIERLLNETGFTLEGLPELYSMTQCEEAIRRSGLTVGMAGNMICHQSDVIERIVNALRSALDMQAKWISVKDRLPEPEQEVLAVCRKRYGLLVVPAIYENGEVDTDDSNWHWYDCDFPYDEENDVYIIPEGWWENRHFNPEDTFNCPIDVPVTHWMPLPEPPKKGDAE